MQKHEEVEFKETLIGLGEYYGKEITGSLTKIYWYDLKPLSIDQLKQAASAHRMNPDNGQFFPKTADLMRQINGTSKQNDQLLEDKADLSWMVVLGEVKRVGSYESLKMEDKQALAAVKSIGGWRFICSKTEAELVWLHKEFIAAYKNFERTPVEALPNNLPGRILLENAKKKGGNLEGGGMKSLAQGVKHYQQNHVEDNKDVR
tara:strand:- start:14 stop:625 length:612 start_codon:yes stop_codon:yes gene_type:complete